MWSRWSSLVQCGPGGPGSQAMGAPSRHYAQSTRNDAARRFTKYGELTLRISIHACVRPCMASGRT
eukprot:COSAG06_NODE_549_length_14405_cov_6.391933_15_plen_66_part_00